jgi:flagellar hook-associated protein 2
MSTISFSGLASGIDSKSLISSIINSQRKISIDPIKRQIQTLTDTNDSLSKFKELLNTLKDSASVFRTINGGSIDKQSTSSNELVATATVSKSATIGTTEITVSQLAKGGTSSFSDRFSSTSQVINSSINNGTSEAERTITVDVGTGINQETISVVLDNTTTADQFIQQFNSQSNLGEASLVNVGTTGSPSYAIVIASINTGTDKGTIAISSGAEVETAGTGALHDSVITASAATNALFSVSGIGGTIERSSNDISDLIIGVAFQLNSVGTATITVSPDKELTKSHLSQFVEAYNEVINYSRENNTIIRDEISDPLNPTNIFAPLAGTRLDENAISQIRSAFSSSSLSGGLVNTLADIGITTERDGTLKFNSTTFSDAFSNDSVSLGRILSNIGEKISSVDGTIAQYTRFGGLIDSATQNAERSIASNNNRIIRFEDQLLQQSESLTNQFARLESIMSRLNQQSQILLAIVPR